MTSREIIEEREREWLSPKAALASASRGRRQSEPEDELRTCFQRDRDRVLHSKAFRRLKHKTQVFLAPEGDHYRTRLTHTLEVAQVARTIARALSLNEDLTEAIALGHDLGHPPFGHAGEAALTEVLAPIGGFRHDEQSLRVVELLEVRVRSDGSTVRGLNLTWEVRDGIATHSKGLDDLETPDRTEVMPATLEGQVARLSDRIAYVHHDTDDSIRAGLITESEVPSQVRSVLGERRGQWLARLVLDVVGSSQDAAAIQMSDNARAALNTLKDFLSERVYHGPVNAAEIEKAQRLLRELFTYYADHPDQISREYRELMQQGEPALRVVGDFLAGMTDRYAIRLAESLLIPRTWAF